MVTGEEYIFENIYEARDYILTTELKALLLDSSRKKAPLTVNPDFLRFNLPYEIIAKRFIIPTNSLLFPFSSFFNEAPDDKFIMTRLQTGRYSLKPNLKNRKYLFRGESEYHSLCKPNLFRNAKKRYFLDTIIYGDEMVRLLLSHPLVQLLDLGVMLDGHYIQFEMNLYGLLQHYYNKTSLLDLTSDINVALFFATQKYDPESDTYNPITDENHVAGVLYFYEIDIMEDFKYGMDNKQLSTIGLQVFPRSGKQRGFLFHHNIDDNFNDLPRLKAFRFKHNAKISKEISEQMNGGESLFPGDILERHWRNEDKRINTVSRDAVKINLTRNPGETIDSIEQKLKKDYGISVEDYKPVFTADELREYYDSIKDENYWENFCNQIYIPGDTEGKMMNDLLNLPNNPKYEWAFKENVSHVIDYKQGVMLKQFEHILKE